MTFGGYGYSISYNYTYASIVSNHLIIAHNYAEKDFACMEMKHVIITLV